MCREEITLIIPFPVRIKVYREGERATKKQRIEKKLIKEVLNREGRGCIE